jgi:hypothetical protein
MRVVALYTTYQDRAVDAEFLGLTVLTKEAFRPRRFFEITQKASYAGNEAQKNIEYWKTIGVRRVCEYACTDALENSQRRRPIPVVFSSTSGFLCPFRAKP